MPSKVRSRIPPHISFRKTFFQQFGCCANILPNAAAHTWPNGCEARLTSVASRCRISHRAATRVRRSVPVDFKSIGKAAIRWRQGRGDPAVAQTLSPPMLAGVDSILNIKLLINP